MKHYGYVPFGEEEIVFFNKPTSNDQNKCKIENVKFNGPATIVFWKDGTKTVSVCKDGDAYDKEKGLLIAILKKYIGGETNNLLNKWCNEQPEEKQKQTSPQKSDNKNKKIELALNDAEMLCALLYTFLTACLTSSDGLSFHFENALLR